MPWRWPEVVAAVGVLAALGVLGVMWRRRRAALAELAKGVAALADGRPVRPTQTRVSGPVGRLARRFDAVAPRLEAAIARLEQDRQQLRAVLGGMAEGVIAVDARRRLLFANDAAQRFFGLDGAAVGRIIAELIRSPQVQQVIESTLAGPGPFQAEISLVGHGALLDPAHSRSLTVHGTSLPGSPTPGAVFVFHDVTDLRRLERMRQDFVANASHELKTPLASIKAFTETLLDGALDDPEVNTRFLQRIDEQADRLAQLIQDLLSLARLESGHDAFDHEPMALAPAVRACFESHRGRAEGKGLDYRMEQGAFGDDEEVLADEEAVRQVLDNLIDNAIKYTPEGGRVKVTCRADDDGRLAVEVADTGAGIPREDLPRIFERFYRVDKMRSRELGGTGLGLAIVKHVVQSLGGQVAVSSRLGAGSVFTVRLPRLNPAAPSAPE